MSKRLSLITTIFAILIVVGIAYTKYSAVKATEINMLPLGARLTNTMRSTDIAQPTTPANLIAELTNRAAEVGNPS